MWGAIDPVVNAIEGLDASARVVHTPTRSMRPRHGNGDAVSDDPFMTHSYLPIFAIPFNVFRSGQPAAA